MTYRRDTPPQNRQQAMRLCREPGGARFKFRYRAGSGPRGCAEKPGVPGSSPATGQAARGCTYYTLLPTVQTHVQYCLHVYGTE